MSTSFPMTIPHAPTGFVNQAALDTAFTVPINDLAALVAALPQGLLGETGSTSTVTIATTAATGLTASVIFTLATQRRVRIAVGGNVQVATAPASYNLRAGYNAGSGVGTPSVVGFGSTFQVSATGTAGINGAFTEGSILLPAGTYTAYATVTRLSGGSATDVGQRNTIAVYDVGAS